MPNERSSLSVRCGRLQLVLAFDTFIVALIALIVELIKSQQKMVNPTTTKNGKKIEIQVPTVELGSPKLRI
ncbi:putative holin-like toxin [Lacticaseibacillus rhamnosus]|nr:putative holin-like toxin [Lacticaseibacillus rhamnosus]